MSSQHRRTRGRLLAIAGVAAALSAAAQLPAGAANSAGSASTASVDQAGPASGRPSSAAVPPVPAIESAVTLANGPRYETAKDGTVYSPLDEPAFIMGHDNGQSALYDNGRGLRFSFWSFGDTALDPRNGDGENFIANTGARTSDLRMGDSISQWEYDGGPDGPREFVWLNAEEEAYNEAHADTDPDTDGCQAGPGIPAYSCGDEYALWGGAVVADPRHGRILAFYSLIRRYHDEQGNFLFDGVGTGVAVWTEDHADGNGWERQIVAHPTDPRLPTALWPEDGDPATRGDPRFDTGMLVRDGYLYAYGCYDGPVLRPDCRLARVPMGPSQAVWDRAAWRFYAGEDRDRSQCPSRWSANLACASILRSDFTNPDGTPGTMTGGAAGTSVFWNPALRMYMAIYGVVISNQMDYSVAYRPEGPWSKPTKLADGVPANGEGLGSIVYANFAHPEYAERGGLVQYVTYAHTTGFLKSDFPVLKVTFEKPQR